MVNLIINYSHTAIELHEYKNLFMFEKFPNMNLRALKIKIKERKFFSQKDLK
jgi:hypothetical protein